MTTIRLKPLAEQTIVITGASSGIGLATARMAGQAGARVVMAARSKDALERAADEIRAAGGQAATVTADVGSSDEVEAIAAEAERAFGGFDSWVNNAGVGIWALIEEVPEADMRRLFETNFWGTVHGSTVALKHLKPKGGALINVGSVTSDRPFPLQGIYSASKHAVKGFTDALRMELEHGGAPVSVTLIKPASIGTPMPQHVDNHGAREAKFPGPVYAPEDVARAILHAAGHPVRDLFVGSAARITSVLGAVAPGLMDKLSARALVDAQYDPERPATPSDNLYHGRSEGEVRGDHGDANIRGSLSTRATTSGFARTVTIAGLAAVGAGLLFRSRDEEGQEDARLSRRVEAARGDA